MQVHVTFRHMEATAALRQYAERRVGRIGRFVRRPLEAHVVLAVERHRHTAEITLSADGFSVVGSGEASDLYAAIDGAGDKVERQVKKRAERRAGRRPLPGRRPAEGRAGDAAPAEPAVRAVPAEPMSVAEARDALGGSDLPCLVFRDADSAALQVLCRRADGRLFLLQPVDG